MARFRVKYGVHTDENERTYKKGAIVESNYPLDRVFVNKFEKVADDAPLPVESTPALKSAKKEETPSQKEVPVEEEEATTTDTSVNEEDQSPSEFGEDATSMFPNAGPGGLKVFRKGQLFSIVDAEEPTVALEQVSGKVKAARAVDKNVKN